MKHIICLFVSLFLSGNMAWGQENLRPLTDIQGFQERLKQEAADVSSIESDFTQEKYLEVFDEKIVSKGRFYYKKADMIRMDYTSPLPYQLTINGQQLRIVSEGKSNVVRLGNNPMMNEMKSLIAACMVGDLQNLSAAYTIAYFETSPLYIIRIKPVSESVQNYIREISISFDKKDMSVNSLRLSETEKDYTEYLFTNRKHNTLTSNELFLIP